MFLEKWNSCRVAAIAALLVAGCSDGGDSTERTSEYVPATVEETGFYGWESVTVKNAFVQLDVVPELSGRIMGYTLLGEQLLWHDPAREGETSPLATSDGSGNTVNIGGAAVLSVQKNDKGDSPRVHEYSAYTVEKDGATVSVYGQTDNRSESVDLEFEHQYTLAPRSTEVEVELSMTNHGTNRATSALSQFVTLPADTSTTIYVPVARDRDWAVTEGDPAGSQWSGIEDGIFRARFNGDKGRVGLRVSDGWAAWHDAGKGIAYVVRFPLDTSAAYPNDHQVEVYSGKADGLSQTDATGNACMEIGVYGPLTDLAPDSRTTLDMTWNSCRCSGIQDVTPVGVVVEKARFHQDYHILTATFGFFGSGTLYEIFYGETDEKYSRVRIMPVNPQSEVVLRRDIYIPLDIVGIRYELWSADDTLAGVIADVKLPEEVIRRSNNR